MPSCRWVRPTALGFFVRTCLTVSFVKGSERPPLRVVPQPHERAVLPDPRRRPPGGRNHIEGEELGQGLGVALVGLLGALGDHAKLLRVGQQHTSGQRFDELDEPLFARNSEGEFSPGITATATTTTTLAGDHNLDNTVDAADYVLWRKNPAQHGDEAGYTTWQSHFGESLAGSGGGAALNGEALAVSEKLPHVVASLRDADAVGQALPDTVYVGSLQNRPDTPTPNFGSKAAHQATPWHPFDHALLAWLIMTDRDPPQASPEIPRLTGDQDDAEREMALEMFDQFPRQFADRRVMNPEAPKRRS